MKFQSFWVKEPRHSQNDTAKKCCLYRSTPRNTIFNNRLRGLRFLFRILQTSTFILGCSPNYFARLIVIYSSSKIYSMFPPTYIGCDYCCVTFVSLFINLRHPRDFTSHTSRKGTLYFEILCYELQDPEILTNSTQNKFISSCWILNFSQITHRPCLVKTWIRSYTLWGTRTP